MPKRLQMDPALIEAHSLRARVLRHAGDLEGAARAADTARRMDLSDRYLNCLAVKALFRAGNVSGATCICSQVVLRLSLPKQERRKSPGLTALNCLAAKALVGQAV